jgi:hypothetical protein
MRRVKKTVPGTHLREMEKKFHEAQKVVPHRNPGQPKKAK